MSNEKIRIFCVITQGEQGGAQQFVIQLSRNLDQERFTLHIIWGATSHDALARAFPSHVTFSTAHHLVRNWSVWHDTLAIFELRKQIASYNPDVVLCISSKAGFIGSLAAHSLRKKLPHIKVIYRIGGWSFNDPNPSWKKQLYEFLERFSAKWKDSIILNNTHDLKQAHQLHINPRKHLLRIYNGIDPYTPFLPQDEARAVLNERLPHTTRRIHARALVGTVANLYPAKDIQTFVRSAARAPSDIRFVVIGDGPERVKIERYISKYNLKDRFILLGRINDAWKYIPAFDVFVLPSIKEGFPWAVLEAMAAKVPVIATKVGAIPEILEHDTSGIICEPGNDKQIADGISRILDNEELRKSFVINAHQQILTKFSLRDMIAQYEKLFTE